MIVTALERAAFRSRGRVRPHSLRLPGTATALFRLAARALALAAALAPVLAAPAPASWEAGPVGVKASLDVSAHNRTDTFDQNGLNKGDSVLDPFRGRLFVDAAVSDRTSVLLQILADDATSASALSVYGAYVLFSAPGDRDLHAEIGKIPNLFGTYAPRTYASKNPVGGMPLLHQYHTSLARGTVPTNAEILARRGQGQDPQTANGMFGTRFRSGLPIAYDTCWDVGAAVFGSRAPVEFALGATQGTLSTPETGNDTNRGKQVLGRLGFVPVLGLRMGASGARGPYLPTTLADRMPAGKDPEDFRQTAAGLDLSWERGHLDLHGEWATSLWDSPNVVGALRASSYYAEAKYSFLPGVYAAARWNQMWFSRIADGTGGSKKWDYDVARLDAAVGVRFSRGVLAKVYGQWNDAGPIDFDAPLVGVQLCLER